MTPQLLIQALTNILSELPHLLGSSWLTFNNQLTAFLEALKSDPDPDTEEEVCERILSLFSEYPIAQNRLLEVLFDTTGRQPLDPEMRHGLLANLVAWLQQQHLYALTITSPSSVWNEVAHFAIMVSLQVSTREMPNALYFVGSPGTTISVEINTNDFQVHGATNRTLTLRSGHDISETTFLLMPLQENLGEHQVRITTVGQGKNIGSQIVGILVHAEREDKNTT